MFLEDNRPKLFALSNERIMLFFCLNHVILVHPKKVILTCVTCNKEVGYCQFRTLPNQVIIITSQIWFGRSHVVIAVAYVLNLY